MVNFAKISERKFPVFWTRNKCKDFHTGEYRTLDF